MINETDVKQLTFWKQSFQMFNYPFSRLRGNYY